MHGDGKGKRSTWKGKEVPRMAALVDECSVIRADSLGCKMSEAVEIGVG